MCLEHLINTINEKDNNKKDNISTFYNINLLFNEIRCLIEKEQINMKNIQSFINEQQLQFEDNNDDLLRKPTFKNKNSLLLNNFGNKCPFISSKLIKKENEII